MTGKFSGFYYKHQCNGHTVAFIPGIAEGTAFIQVITDNKSMRFNFDNAVMSDEIVIGNNIFSKGGIIISLPNIKGKINYSFLTPICSDIMGPFRFFPMECRHKIISMRHMLNGSLTIDDEIYNFNQGIGYIEGDCGKSFPRKYIWIQANDFSDFSSFMFSLAQIPFMKMHFEGVISVLIINGHEYRLATYYGAKVSFSQNVLKISQGKMKLTIRVIDKGKGYSLSSPVNGEMTGIIKENNNAVVEIKFSVSEKTIYHQISSHAGLEIFGYNL